MAITTLDGIKTALPGQQFPFIKSLAMTQTGVFFALSHAGIIPAAPAAPSSGLSGAVVTKTSYFNFVNPSAGNSYLGRIEGISTVPFIVLVYDRLWDNSGLSATATTGQTINSVALNRPDALGADVEIWWQAYVALGTGTPTVNLVYTNQDNVGSRAATSGAFAASSALGRTGPFQLQAGDTGVRSIQTWTATATFQAGTIGLVMRRRLAMLAMPAGNFLYTFDALSLGMKQVLNDAALEFIVLNQTNATHTFSGELNIVQG